MSATASEFAIICASVTEVIQNIERRYLLGLPPESITAKLGPVTCVAVQNRIGIMTITVSLSRSDQCVVVATFSITERSEEVGAPASVSRVFYSSKADADDRLKSKHPTVKPVDLMAYLARLVLPPGGVLLDPFAGSGSMGMAALRDGFDCILIEREAEYVADINRRIAHVSGLDAPLFNAAQL